MNTPAFPPANPPPAALDQALTNLSLGAVRAGAFLTVARRALHEYGVHRDEDMAPVLTSLEAAARAWAREMACATVDLELAAAQIENYLQPEAARGAPEGCVTASESA